MGWVYRGGGGGGRGTGRDGFGVDENCMCSSNGLINKVREVSGWSGVVRGMRNHSLVSRGSVGEQSTKNIF